MVNSLAAMLGCDGSWNLLLFRLGRSVTRLGDHNLAPKFANAAEGTPQRKGRPEAASLKFGCDSGPRIPQHDIRVAIRAGGDHCQWATGQLFQRA